MKSDIFIDAAALHIQIQHLHFPFIGFGIAGIEAHQIASEYARFIAAGARADFDNHIFVIAPILGQQHPLELLLQGRRRPFQFSGFHLRQFSHLGIIGRMQQFPRLVKLLQLLLILSISADDVLQTGPFFGQLGRFFIIAGDVRPTHHPFQFLIAAFDLRQFFQHETRSIRFDGVYSDR